MHLSLWLTLAVRSRFMQANFYKICTAEYNIRSVQTACGREIRVKSRAQSVSRFPNELKCL